jgi:hypothetical protein
MPVLIATVVPSAPVHSEAELLGKMRHDMQELTLADTELSSGAVVHLATQCTQLRHLSLLRCSTNASVAHIAAITSLTSLVLSETQRLACTDMAAMLQLPSLRALVASGVDCSGFHELFCTDGSTDFSTDESGKRTAGKQVRFATVAVTRPELHATNVMGGTVFLKACRIFAAPPCWLLCLTESGAQRELA